MSRYGVQRPRPPALAAFGWARTIGTMSVGIVSWTAPMGVIAAALAAVDPASEHAACVQLRDEGKAVEAAPRCRAAYDALASDTTEAALQDRAVIVFDAHHTYQEAYQASRERSYLCDEAAMLEHFLAFLQQQVTAEARQADRRDARKLLDELRGQLGDQGCADAVAGEGAVKGDEIPEDKLLPVSPVLRRPVSVARSADTPPPPKPVPGVQRPLRVAGAVTLGVGLVAGMATAGVLVYGEQLQRQRDALLHQDFMPGQVPEETRRASDLLLAEGQRANAIAASIGAIAAVSTISGITLLSVDAVRQRRAHRVAIHPSAWPSVGLRASVEF